ncbi:MAG: hypothetical protein J5774_02315 [Clostridia bacterium]|nr:hypothetical protein [Clostridia bacterium]
MKKRLLITSIVMMLVVAVALSTATYAWFTNSNSVTASSVSLTAKTSDQTALGIGWSGAGAGSELTNSLSNGSIDPMAPVSLVANTTEYDVDFNTATIKSDAGNLVFNDDVTTAHPVVFNNGLSNAAYRDTFYVKNLSAQNTIDHVTITASFTAAASDGTDLIRAAVFLKNGSDKYVLKGILATTQTANGTVWGPTDSKLKAGERVDALNTYATVTSIDLGGLATQGQHDLAIVVWMDGTALNDTMAGYGGSVSFTFTATND